MNDGKCCVKLAADGISLNGRHFRSGAVVVVVVIDRLLLADNVEQWRRIWRKAIARRCGSRVHTFTSFEFISPLFPLIMQIHFVSPFVRSRARNVSRFLFRLQIYLFCYKFRFGFFYRFFSLCLFRVSFICSFTWIWLDVFAVVSVFVLIFCYRRETTELIKNSLHFVSVQFVTIEIALSRRIADSKKK